MLIWWGLVVYCVGSAFEGAVTGTAYQKRVPSALLGAWLLMLAGFGMCLFGYQRRVAKVGLPAQSAILIWTALGGLLFLLGWANLRGGMNLLVTESQRDLLVWSGVFPSLACFVMAMVSLIRYGRRLNPEQRALWQQTWKWPALVTFLVLIAGSSAIALIARLWLKSLST